MSYTPGPWVTRDGDVCYIRKNQDQSFGMAVSLATTYGINDEENARLIAAAPDLLESLKEYVNADKDDEQLNARKRMALAAIAKAEGRA